MRALPTTLLRTLGVSAASGLVRHDGRFWVVADDELGLYSFPLQGGGALAPFALFPGALPEAAAARKAAKPDLEALALLPAGSAGAVAALLAVPSGSTEKRARGALVAGGKARIVDFAAFYASLRTEIPELNVEGAAVCGDRLVLLQRGNGKRRFNALIVLDLAAMVAGLTGPGALAAGMPRTIVPVALGALAGTPLSFTDATPLGENRILFTAAAEATDDPYLDGACAGSVVGFCALTGQLGDVLALEPAIKAEGIHADEASGDLDLFLVTDADDRAKPSELRHARLNARTTRRNS